MRIAMRQILTALVAGTAAVTMTTTGTSAVASAAAAAATATADPGAIQRPARVVVATGERVSVSQVGKRLAYGLEPAAAEGTSASRATAGTHTFQLGERTFIVPIVAMPYLGRTLDPSLFEVSALAKSKTPGRIPIEVAHTGGRPELPGVTVTSDSGGVARGYVSAAAAPRFGAAVAAQWRADQQRPSALRTAVPTDGLFRGITRMGAAGVPAVARTAHLTTAQANEHTFTVKAIDPAGAPMQGGMGLLINVDDSSLYTGFVWLDGGSAEVTVPAGNYSAVFDWVGSTPSGAPMVRTVPVGQFTVNGPGQAITVDARRATTKPSVRVPRPVASGDQAFTYYRGDALGAGGISTSQTVPVDGDYAVRQTGVATVGVQSFSTVFHLEGPSTSPAPPPSPAYTYDLYFRSDRVNSDQRRTIGVSLLATARARYDSDPAVRATLFGRYPVVAAPAPFFALHALAVPAQRTEYVYGQGNPVWGEVELGNTLADDAAQLDGFATYPPRSRQPRTWRQAPLGAGIPMIPADSPSPLCRACRSDDSLWLALAPFKDSQPDHVGSLRPSPDRSPVSHLRLTAGDTVLLDADDTSSAMVTAPSASTGYEAVLDVDRTWTAATTSVRSHTVLTFTSAASQGPVAPRELSCVPALAPGCQVLPVLQARAEVPTSGTGTLPVGTSTIDVVAHRVQGAAPSAVSSAALQLRAAGSAWVDYPLTALGEGRFRAQVLLPQYQAGRAFDLRVKAADVGGSAFDQTIVRAFTLAASAG